MSTTPKVAVTSLDGHEESYTFAEGETVTARLTDPPAWFVISGTAETVYVSAGSVRSIGFLNVTVEP